MTADEADDDASVSVDDSDQRAVDTVADPAVRCIDEVGGPAGPVPPRWLRSVVILAAVVTIMGLAVVGYGALQHHSNETADDRSAGAVTAARNWVNLFVTATDDSVIARADQITAQTVDPLHADAMNRIEPYLEMLSDDGSGHPLRVTSAAVEREGSRAGRPPVPPGATTVLVTTTARSGQLGHGYALWLYVVDDAGTAKIADFGGAG